MTERSTLTLVAKWKKEKKKKKKKKNLKYELGSREFGKPSFPPSKIKHEIDNFIHYFVSNFRQLKQNRTDKTQWGTSLEFRNLTFFLA